MLSRWFKQSCALILNKLWVWALFLLVFSVVLALGMFSQALTIVLAVIGLFIGVGLAAYSDNQFRLVGQRSLSGIIRQCLPLAIIAALYLVGCWFSFRVVANLYAGEGYKIAQFFGQSPEQLATLQTKPWRELTADLYEIAIVTLIFTLMMLTSFASWFSFPLMVFNDYRWSRAKEDGNKAAKEYRLALSKLMYASGLMIIFGLGWLPLLTPVVYIFISLLMYVSYREAFAVKA